MSAATHPKASRNTRQSALVRDELALGDGFRSAQAIFSDMRAGGESVGLSTVYRHLRTLAEAGEADTLQTGEGEVLYRLCGPTGEQSHHHHLVCRDCGRTVEIEATSVERWVGKIAEDNGFSDVDHTVELLGRCEQCRIRLAG